MSIEVAHDIMMATRIPEIASEYVEVVSQIQQAIDIKADRDNRPDKEATIVATRYYHPLNLAPRLDKDAPAVKAAMLDGAISFSAYRYRNLTTPNTLSYEDLWRNTLLQRWAAKCDEIVESLRPSLDARYIHVNIQEMWADFNQTLIDGGPESLIITGLNGVGKSTQIEALMAFLRMANIKSRLIKLPSRDGIFSQFNKMLLAGKIDIGSKSMQHFFLSNAFSFGHDSDTFTVFDRHPVREILAYAPSNMIMTAITANELLGGNVWTVILDRHFKKTHSEVQNRIAAPRIFERKEEDMVNQFLRYSGLTFLPGVIWINGDTAASTSVNWSIEYTMRKFFGGIFASGVLQRRMVKIGLTDSFENADSFLWSAFMEFLDRWKTTPNWIKNLG